MKDFCFVDPEVPGQLGCETVIDTSTHPPKIEWLHIAFDGWLGDVLLECFPAYFVPEIARRAIEARSLTGAKFEEMKATTSLVFEELYPGRELPKFWRFVPEGKFLQDDFSIAPDYRLTVSDRALNLLQEMGLRQADVQEVTS